MDSIDKKLLAELQRNATIPLSELSKKVGISTTPCWNRIRKLEENGTILSKNTVLNNKKINLNIVVFLSVSVSTHTEEWLNSFLKIMNDHDEIIEVYRLTGTTTDYMLKIVAPSIEKYDQFQQKLISEITFTKMSSSIALKQLKKINYLPLDYI
tara:strand:- start:411 stop:872 length:462 start_codon:yes stop_codon:yes gene_type:complete